jgi:hypothetical protein
MLIVKFARAECIARNQINVKRALALSREKHKLMDVTRAVALPTATTCRRGFINRLQHNTQQRTQINVTRAVTTYSDKRGPHPCVAAERAWVHRSAPIHCTDDQLRDRFSTVI